MVINKAVQDLSKRIEADAPQVLPKGMGRLTHENIETEARDWNRFLNSRAIASYSGLTGGVSSSGESRSDLRITKAGNRRLRTELVELSWRFLLYPADDYLLKK